MASIEVKVALAIVAAVAVTFGAYQAASVFAPLVLALFIIGITWPLQQALQSRMPKAAPRRRGPAQNRPQPSGSGRRGAGRRTG